MDIESLAIPDVKLLTPRKFGDHRGFFSETHNRKSFASAGIDLTFVQDNHAYTAEPWTLRGLHFQAPPFAQDKLVRVTRGRILDVAVDLRRGSATYGRHVSAEVGAAAWNQILVPIGFAHGYLTLEPHTEVIYKVSNYYSAENEHGIAWNDPDLAIDWPLNGNAAILSEKDRTLRSFHALESPF